MRKFFFVFFCFFSVIFAQNPEKTIEDILPYPLEKFQQQEILEEKIQNSMVQISCYSTPLVDLVEEWKTMIEIPIVISSQIYLYRNDQQLRISLNTEEIKFQKALELVTRYLDLIYYIDQDVLMIALPGSKPSEDTDKRLWNGLKNARSKYESQKTETNTTSSIQETLNKTISLELSSGSLDKIARGLEDSIQSPVLVDLRLNDFFAKENKKEFFLSAREQKLQEILDQFCRSYNIAWIVEGNAIYFSLPEYIAPMQASQEKKKKEDERVMGLWKSSLNARILLPLARYSLPQIIQYLKSQWRVDLIVEPEIWQRDIVYSFKEKSLSLKELLDILAQENQAVYILGENNIVYLIQEGN
ncbi:MAG: hypothetical protein HUU50_09625 [Candidatus Brocadiae bacterium]|nr:hypothetical protein [Candidatus Brocadiia bacterium]